MTKPGSFSCSDGAASHSTVFIDTSLETRLAMVVLDIDTVSDLKEKIEKEHPLCFPHVGNIKIHALKVKRKGYFYHLSDSMYLKSAFVGINKTWFLFVDASIADDYSTNPNTVKTLTYSEMVNDTSVHGINLARNSHSGQIPNHGSPQLPDNVALQIFDEKACSNIHFDSCHSGKMDLVVKKAEVLMHSVENCSKVQSGRTGDGREDHNEPLECLPAVEGNHKSKKRKTKLMNERVLEVDNHSIEANAQNPLQAGIGSPEKFREFNCEEVSDLPMMASKSNGDEACRNSSSDTHNEFRYGLRGKYKLSGKTGVVGELHGKIDKSMSAFHLTHNSSLKEAAPTAKEMHKIGKIDGVKDLDGSRDLVSDSNKVTFKPEVTSDNLSENEQTEMVVSDSLFNKSEDRLLETDSSNVKKKKKKKKEKLSVYPNQAVTLASSREGAEWDASRESDITTVPGYDVEDASNSKLLEISVREKHNDSNHKTPENCASSLVGRSDVNMNNTHIADVQSMRNASDNSVPGLKRKTDTKSPAFYGNDPICTSEDANCAQSNHRACGQTAIISEKRDSMQNAATKATMVENCQSSSRDGTDINADDTQISQLPQSKGAAKTTKCSEKRKTRKFKDSTEGRQISSVVTGAKDSARGISSAELHSIEGDNSSSKAEIEKTNIALKKEENIASGSILPTDVNLDIDEADRSKVEPLLQINKTQVGAENMDEQVRKKFKKRPMISMKSMSDHQAEVIGNEDSSPSKTSNREVKSVSKMAKKTKLPKVKPKNEIEEANLETLRPSEIENSAPITKKTAAFSVPRTKSNSKNSKNMVHQDQKRMEHQSIVVGHPMGGRKSSRNGIRDVARSAKKNLLAASGGIFEDASSDSSKDEYEIVNSDASTRSPDDSLSSDFSDEESKADGDQSRNGSIDLKGKKIHGRSIRKTRSSSPENMTLDTILRSSSRYKKARLTAAQSQLEDTESQPVDVVPDSQPTI